MNDLSCGRTPIGQPGPLTETERFLFDAAGYLVIPGALTAEEAEACREAAIRCHSPFPQGLWRQLGATFEQEPAIEALIDHPSILPKARALLGDRFILQSSWCTLQPAGGAAGGYHQDGSGPYEFRNLALPTPLVQLRVGFFLTDQSKPGMGNMILVPGSHNARLPMPVDFRRTGEEFPYREIILGKPGDALVFHQGVFHCTGANEMDFDRYTMHMVYAPPWLAKSDRVQTSPDFMARTTPLRRALMGEWERPEAPFGMGYEAPPFDVA